LIRFLRRKVPCWLRSHRKLVVGLVLAAVVIFPNALAFLHARALMHFTPGGTRTRRPEALSILEKAGVVLTGVRIPRPENDGNPGRYGLLFEVHRFPGGDGVELEAWYVPVPGRPRGLVLMFHGYAACKSSLLAEASAFHELGYATFLVDFRGGGGSSGMETSIGVHEADDVAGAWDYARTRWPNQPLILYGQSMGSAAILRAVAVRGIGPRALVLECPFDRLLSTVENRFSAMGLPSFPGAGLLVFWGGVQQGFNGFKHNPADYAREVEIPTLLLHGATDPRVTLAQAEAVFANLQGPKRFELFPDTGHEPYIARGREQWRRAVAGFLAPDS
jgi:alpha-beta hydrolase superfamily lysophospholipase